MGSKGSNSKMLEGTIERVVYRNDKSAYTVLRLKPKSGPGLLTVVGVIQELSPGESVKFSGQWIVDKKFGKQFKAETCLPLAPATLIGIEKFLGSGMVPGIGKVMAKRIVDKLGMDTLEIIESSPSKLATVEGIGKVRAKAISASIVEKKEIKNVMVFLESAGVSPAYAHRVYKRYKNRSIQIVSENPYRLASEVHGIGFKMADDIARHLGVPLNSRYRAEAGLLYALLDFSKDGHVYVPRDVLLPAATELLQVDIALLESALDQLLLIGDVRHVNGQNGKSIYLKKLDKAERDIAKHLKRILNGRPKKLQFNSEEQIHKIENKHDIQFAPEQKHAFSVLQKAKIMVLTGGPGTGKTTLLNGLITSLVVKKHSISLAAPTGRAAKRMTESTNRQAMTIHRLLEFTPRSGGFTKCESDPLLTDVLVVDESSMIDVELFASLLAAVPDGARLILVGDPDQLPSVGPGSVLADMLELGQSRLPGLQVVRLQEIFRQARSSLIITGAHQILKGQLPNLGKKGDKADLFMIEREEPEGCLELIKETVSKRIPAAFGFDPIEDIQVLTPMHKGILGASNLNSELQALLNPNKQGVVYGERRYCQGDKVMQVRNNYDLDVYNGDVGKVVEIDTDQNLIKVDYGFKKVTYPQDELDQVVLSFACSIHKSQGSEYPVVVLPVHTQHFVMLQQNLLYTAITRGKKLVVLIGTKRALGIAVRNNESTNRCSGLVSRVLQ